MLPPHLVQGPRAKLDRFTMQQLTLSPAYEGSLQSVVVLSGSSFLKPAQQLLDDVCAALLPPEGGAASSSPSLSSSSLLLASAGHQEEHRRPEFRERKDKLLHMQHELQYIGMEVRERYNQHRQQMQMVVSSFESVPGLSCATPYLSSVLKDVSNRFRRLRMIILKKIQCISRLLEEELISLPEGCSSGCKALAVWKPRKGQHPERAVSVMRAWLFDNFLHPYPSDEDKQMLATRTCLTQNQVSNWFVNARVRLWKPMVDEMHMLETLSSSPSSFGGHLVG